MRVSVKHSKTVQSDQLSTRKHGYKRYSWNESIKIKSYKAVLRFTSRKENTLMDSIIIYYPNLWKGI